MNYNFDSIDIRRFEIFFSFEYFINNFNYFKENVLKRENGKIII